ncbi:LuxR C-terminal-related transcriptional regulator [Halomonas lysinitropha]|uniref:CsgBAC operon transcriptional regulatory protein n=1 Tax=Halomonas lysinitropha TaxID=2607506 RepID=A0A5K1I9M2_9GAMM|nr:LuxR C-terminal-related transcriptional regulator [Halomonas lysinitropha]VVZ97023.1 CsgBAC operon transcriptional regulatory protein [Halomonas lysinitropha]
MEPDTTLILLVTELTAQAQLFGDYLHRQLGCLVDIQAPGDSPPRSPGSVLLLLDVDHLDEADLQAWERRAEGQPGAVLAAFNLRDEAHAADLLAGLSLQGVFYRRDSLELICKGVETLVGKSQPWLSRSLMARLLERYRDRQVNLYRPSCGLTHREIEILGLLSLGVTNARIADHLFVSEHTVKSHLYNIFKKIGVHTRCQAADWARNHLGPPPPLEPHPLPRYLTPH